jgi:3-hydroxy-9,10-secoandrosta-1,3,5(10)-triene-9,17-dione monooxygenase reductase component
VTVWTSTSDETGAAGITVASTLVAEGRPPMILGLIDPLSTFADAAAASGRFVVHVVAEGQHKLADQLAGRSPAVLDRFDDLDVAPSAWGPVLRDLTTRASCSVLDTADIGESILIRAAVDEVDLSDAPPAPLVYIRGFYGAVRPLPDRPPHFR